MLRTVHGVRVGRIASVAGVLFAMLASNSATAQSRSVDAERFQPAFDDAGFIGLNGTRTPEPGRVTVGLIGDLAYNPIETYPTAVKTRLITHLLAEVGLFGRLAVGVRLPLILYQRPEDRPGLDRPVTVDELASVALMDPQLALRYRFLGTSMADKDAPRDGPGLALQLSAALPFGTEDAWASDRALQTEAALLADFQLLGAGAGASVGWRHHYKDGVPAVDEFTFAIGLKLPLPPLPALTTALELRGATEFADRFTTALELGLGANLALGDFVIVLAGAVGLATEGIGTPDGRVTLGLRWSPSVSDSDGDGLRDGDDDCPFLAEDFDGYQDDDGCPEPDNDNDLVPDLDDRCPNAQAEEGKDDDEDGCTDK